MDKDEIHAEDTEVTTETPAEVAPEQGEISGEQSA